MIYAPDAIGGKWWAGRKRRHDCRKNGHGPTTRFRTHHPKDLHEQMITVNLCLHCGAILNPEVLK